MERAIPLGRAGTPADGAGAVYLLCIPESDYVSGQVVICGAASTHERSQPAAEPNRSQLALNSAAAAAAASIASTVASSSDAGMCADAFSKDSTAATRPCARASSRSPRASTSASTQMAS